MPRELRFWIEKLVKKIGQRLRGLDRLILEPHQRRNSARLQKQPARELCEINPMIGREKAIEVQRQVLVRGVRNRANRRARNAVPLRHLPKRVRFHLDGVIAGRSPKLVFLIRGAGHARGALETPGKAAEREKLLLPGPIPMD